MTLEQVIESYCRITNSTSQILHKSDTVSKPKQFVIAQKSSIYLCPNSFSQCIIPTEYSVDSLKEINPGLLASTPGISFPLTLEKATLVLMYGGIAAGNKQGPSCTGVIQRNPSFGRVIILVAEPTRRGSGLGIIRVRGFSGCKKSYLFDDTL